MENNENLVGKKINLDKLTKELDRNNHKLKVNDFLNILYTTLGEMEENHPVVKGVVEKLGIEYSEYICSIIFSLCIRLAQATMTKETFIKMIDRISMGDIEIDSGGKVLN